MAFLLYPIHIDLVPWYIDTSQAVCDQWGTANTIFYCNNPYEFLIPFQKTLIQLYNNILVWAFLDSKFYLNFGIFCVLEINFL